MLKPVIFGVGLAVGMGLMGCNGSSGPTTPMASLSPSVLEFSAVPVGEDAVEVVSLSNAGGGVLEVLSISLVTGDSRVWNLDRDPSMSQLSASETLPLTVTFSPRQDESLEEARFQVRTSDGENPSIYLDLTGQGTPATTDGDGDGFSPAEGDCDDSRDDVYPGAEELCDGRDNDCDGNVASEEADDDGDGVRICAGDCDDADRNVYPGAEEVCDDKDTDCDGNNLDRSDIDGDGFSLCDGDCDDTENTVNPGQEEVCDELDNDCDGAADNIDKDMDGYSLCASGGDCDDNDPDAHPVVLDPNWTGAQTGTAEEPYSSVGMALDNLDEVCQSVWIVDGTFELSVTLDAVPVVTFGGSGPDNVTLKPPAGSPVFNVSGGSLLAIDGLELADADTTGDGGAVRVVASNVLLHNARLRNNKSSGDGGAISITSGDLQIFDSEFIGNMAADDGGAIAALSSMIVDRGSTYSGNQGVRGGALLLEATISVINESTFVGNKATDSGGAIQAVAGIPSIHNTTLWSNEAVNGGGGISLTDVSDVSSMVANNRFQDNDGGDVGGGVAIRGSIGHLVLANNTLTGNMATSDGGAIFVDATDTASLSIVSNIWAYSDGKSGLYVRSGSKAGMVANTGYATSGGDDFEGEASASGTNTSENPVFEALTNNGDPADDDLTLKSTSPMINTGPSDTAWNDPDGSRNDRGYTGGPGAL